MFFSRCAETKKKAFGKSFRHFSISLKCQSPTGLPNALAVDHFRLWFSVLSPRRAFASSGSLGTCVGPNFLGSKALAYGTLRSPAQILIQKKKIKKQMKTQKTAACGKYVQCIATAL